MARFERTSNLPPPLIAIAGWLVPGAGYWLIGERARGTIVCAAILLLYVLGLLIAGVRVIEVPGYDTQTGRQIRAIGTQRIPPGDRRYGSARWILTGGGFIGEITNKPWFAGQVLAGPTALISAAASISAGQRGIGRPHAAMESVGTLYTAVAGMLNLLVIIDAVHRAGLPKEAE